MDNIVYMFGIALLEHDGYCDFMDDSTQYKVVKWKLSDMNKYIGNAGKSDLYEDTEILTVNDCMEEFMFLGLRKRAGISEREFKERFRVGLKDIYGKVIAKYEEMDLLEWTADGKMLRLTDAGIDVSDYIFCDFML